MIRVFLEPTGLHSRAMLRVARALAAYAPRQRVEIVTDETQADVKVLHVIGPLQSCAVTSDTAIIQYCLQSAGMALPEWVTLWRRAKLVWSYFDLPVATGCNGFPFYHAPLGVDSVFTSCAAYDEPRDIAVMSSGYVSHPAGEAIEEVAIAADALNLQVVHLGPAAVEGMFTVPKRWTSVLGITDDQLVSLYRRTEWVSGLRHVEGFEIPSIEALACGARPIVFDRPDMTQWYEGHAVFVPESCGEELIAYLTEVLAHRPVPVLDAERDWVHERFNWKTITNGFWERIL